MKIGKLHAAAGMLSAGICAGALAACAGGPDPAPIPSATAGTGPTVSFAYQVPSPPSALYHIEDSTVVGGSMAGTDFETLTMTLLTMNTVFAREPTGIGAIGSVVGFDVTATNPLMGAIVADIDDISGPLAMILSRQGHLEIGSMPSLDSAVADLSPFPAIAFDMFPRLPPSPVGQGGTWVDTVSWSVTDETSESATRTVYTYTLTGESEVDGVTLLNIAVEGDVAMQLVEGVGDVLLDQRLSGTVTGYILWDPERNLPKISELYREIEGSNQIPGAGTVDLNITSVVRVRAAY